jgi:hypothetical protein
MMSADWSAIRRRQTLGEVQNHVGQSQIPQPSSVFKKSGAGRASVAPGGVAGLGPAPRSSIAPQRFFRSSSGGNIAGEVGTGSMGSSLNSSQRDSLRNSRQSYAPQSSIKYILVLYCLLTKWTTIKYVYGWTTLFNWLPLSSWEYNAERSPSSERQDVHGELSAEYSRLLDFRELSYSHQYQDSPSSHSKRLCPHFQIPL